MNPQRQSLSVPIAIVVAGALIAFGIYWSGRGNAAPAKAVPKQTASASAVQPVGPDDHVLGNPKAQVVLVEYSDIECPYCKQFHTTLNSLVSEYGAKGQIAWAFRHFPVHANSAKEAAATECAAEIGGNDGFWKYLDRIFEVTPSNNGLDLSQLPGIAKDVGLDETRFSQCLASDKFSAKIDQQRSDALAAGAQGTPYTVIFSGGDRIPITEGALPYADMKQIIETVLKR